MEHRWGERVSVRLPVELSGGSCPAIPGSIENVSSSGAFVRTPGVFPPRGPVEVRLSAFPEQLGRAARIAGYIVREAEDGVGVEWRQFAPHAIRELVRLAPESPRAARRGELARAVLSAVAVEARSEGAGMRLAGE